MFGGIGIFKETIMFGLVADDTLYLKANDVTKAPYEAEGFGPWVYGSKSKKTIAMPYWQVPDRLFDEPEEFAEWARIAFAAAEQKKKNPPPKKTAGKKAATARKAAKRPPARSKPKPKKKTAPKRR
jgi:DNA transformation protein